jgi:hypothetical protein
MAKMTMAVQTDRDYAKEIRALIDQATEGGTYTPGTVAEQLVNFLRENDPELLIGWLNAQAVYYVRQAILRRDASARAHNRVQACRSVFKDAAEEFEKSGDSTELRSHFLTEAYVVSDGSRMLLKDMTSMELSYVADKYSQLARTSLLREAFLRALAKRCGDRPVGEVLDEETVATMWCSIAGE